MGKKNLEHEFLILLSYSKDTIWFLKERRTLNLRNYDQIYNIIKKNNFFYLKPLNQYIPQIMMNMNIAPSLFASGWVVRNYVCLRKK